MYNRRRILSDPRAARFALILGAALLSVVVLTVAVGNILLLMGAGVHPAAFPVAAIVTAAWVTVWILRTDGREGRWLIVRVLSAAVVVVALSLGLGPLVLDATYDGQWYHQEAILQLASGWNPIEGDLTPAEVADPGALPRINGHAKGPWIAGASLYLLTGRIEHNKAFSMVLLASAGCLAFAALIGFGGLGRLQTTLVAGVMACSPTALTQILNAQVDGDLASVLLITIASLVVYARFQSQAALVVLTTALVLGFSLKITAPLSCLGVVVAGFAPLIATRVRLAPVLISLTVGGVVGLLWAPSSPYLGNTIRHGHPLYPAMGPHSVGMIDAPPHGRTRTLATSLFSRSRQFPTTEAAIQHLLDGGDLKLPGTFDSEEVKVFAMPDVRIGGFGPLFGALLVLTTATAIASGRRRLALAAGMAVPILISVLAFPFPWASRLVPQLWLVPMIVLPLGLTARSRAARVLGRLAVVVAGANLLLISVGHLYGVLPHSELLRTRIAELGRRGTDLQLHLGRYPSNRARLTELGVSFTAVDDLNFDLQTYLGSPKARVLSLEPVDLDGESVVILRLEQPVTATFHTVTVIPVENDRRGAGRTHPVTGGRGEIPVPSGTYVLELAVCNAVGCGPPLLLDQTDIALAIAGSS